MKNSISSICSSLFGLALLPLFGCDDRSPTTILDPTPRPPAVYVLSGTVYEHSSTTTPKTDALLEVSNFGPSVPFWRTDSAGRYRVELEGWRGQGGRVKAHADGYLQPCRGLIDLKDGENILDIHLVSTTILRQQLPESFPVTAPAITGRIFSRASGSDVSIAGAWVGAEVGFFLNDDPFIDASTLSDRSGRFLLCGMKSVTAIHARAQGFRQIRVEIDPRKQTYDIELQPN